MRHADEQVTSLMRLLSLPTYELRAGEKDNAGARAQRSELERLIEERFRPLDIDRLAATGQIVMVTLPIRLSDLLVPMSYGLLVVGPFFSEPIGEEEFGILLSGTGIQEQASSYRFYRSLPYLSSARLAELTTLLELMLETGIDKIDLGEGPDDGSFLRLLLGAELGEDFVAESSDLYVRCVRALSRRDLDEARKLGERYARVIERTPTEYFSLQRDLVRNEYVLMCSLYHEVRRLHAASFVSYLGQRLEACESVRELADFQREMTDTFARKLADDDLAGLPPDIMEVRLYIHDHYRERISLDQLARIAGLSPSRLSTRFRECCGTSVSDCILERRIEQAKRLLLYSRVSIAKVGGLVGMPDASYFSRRFRKATGLTPREFREAFERP